MKIHNSLMGPSARGVAREISRIAVVGVTAVVLVGTSCFAASAEEDANPVVGIAPLPKGFATLADTPEVKAELAETEAKYKVFELWAKKAELSQGGASSSDLKAVDAQIASAELKVQKVAGEPLGKVSVSKLAATAAGDTTVTPMAFPTPAEARSLTLTHSSQSNGYYCAPASTAMVIRMSGGSETSRYNSGHKMSQTVLASSTYLATSSSQGTSMHRVPITLQRWMGLSTDVYAGPTATKLKNLTAGAIGVLGHGVEYGTHETAGAKHYNNHPSNRSIDHYIAGFGYSSNGSNVKWADPATSIWSGLATKGNMSASNMAGFVSRFGIIA